MRPVEKRNIRIRQILDELYEISQDDSYFIDETSFADSLDMLFTTETFGYREILLVILIGMMLNSDYRASIDLYDCKPRGLYEGPIKEFMLDNDIPHRKSGPLNIAKATSSLDHTWAAQRREPEIASEVVKLVAFLEEDDVNRENRIHSVAISLLRRFAEQSIHLKTLSIEIDPSHDPEYIYLLCSELINKAPDVGNTPQKIAGFLLKHYHLSMDTGVFVSGLNDRASVTSTTSKKLGDISEEKPFGTILKAYEITVKQFDLRRIRDSYDSIYQYNSNKSTNINEIIVICRSKDCPINMKTSGLYSYLGSYEYRNIRYYFWDIFEWIASILQRMTDRARSDFYLELNKYIDDINTSKKVKRLWKKLHKS